MTIYNSDEYTVFAECQYWLTIFAIQEKHLGVLKTTEDFPIVQQPK